MNTMGGVLSDVVTEIRCLWIQAAAYFGFACIVYGIQMRLARRHAQERLAILRKKREIRLQLKQKIKNSDAQ
jgi:ABC-2 type transport system permease protein